LEFGAEYPAASRSRAVVCGEPAEAGNVKLMTAVSPTARLVIGAGSGAVALFKTADARPIFASAIFPAFVKES
jgi:hypothetical protein